MTAPAGEDTGLDMAAADLYGGRLDDFVQRRDLLVKQLRSSGQREAAAAVKAMRKPSRTAWALDQAARNSKAASDALADAVTATLDAQAGGGDVRAAISELRTAVREFAGEAARLADEAGYQLDPPVLANAVLAVLGMPDAFAALRRGSLADVPEAGGLDFFTSLSAPSAIVAREAPPDVGARAKVSAAPSERAGLESIAREAAASLAAARERAQDAQRMLRQIESALNNAELRLRQAEEEVRAARSQRDQAREEADAAAAQLVDAERAHAEAKQRLDML